jgi:hypothetical protein
MVTEFLKLGPLDQYLLRNKAIMKPEDLVESSTALATALWHMVCFIRLGESHKQQVEF